MITDRFALFLGLPLALSFLCLACSGPQATAPANSQSAPQTTRADDELLQQEDRVDTLRSSSGTDDPETLQAIAKLIRLRTTRRDLESGAALFDEILALDLRSSPVLAYSDPPIQLARDLGGLGELTAARILIEQSLPGSRKALGTSPFIARVDRALARLKLALGEGAGEENSSGGGGTAAATARPKIPQDAESIANLSLDEFAEIAANADLGINFSERPIIGAKDWSQEPEADRRWAERTGIHEHFDRILDISPKPALEVAERLRSTLSRDVSLVTRIRRHGGAGQVRSPPIVRRLDVSQNSPQAGPLPDDPELLRLTTQVQAVTRALDRAPAGDRRLEPLLTERQRLQGKRAELLNQTWNSIEETYIPTTAADVQGVLDKGTVVLYYMVASDHTDLLVLTHSGQPRHYLVPLGSQTLEDELTLLLADSSLRSTRGVAVIDDPSLAEPGNVEVARRLFAALIAPAAREIEAADRLLVISDGPLHQLPFAALKRPLEDGEEQYLADWKPLHHAPSAAVYMALMARRTRVQNQPPSGALVAFGDPAYNRSGDVNTERALPFAVRSATPRGFSGQLAQLPGTKREVEQIGKMFRANDLSAQIFSGHQAREDQAKTQVEDSNYLHFAVHGFVDGSQGEHSFLALSLPEALAEGQENGILEGWEIVDQLTLDAELVTLSACETALGQERGGEGPVSLNRSFLAAGSKSVLAALWQVDDTATAELMIRFYRRLLDGSSKAEALRLAQRELLHDSDLGFQAPYYWAGFQLTGDWL